MALKSHKIKQQPEESVLTKRHRSLKLSDLERRTKLRKRSKRKTPKINILGGLRRLNQSLNKQASRMPSGDEVNKMLWR